MGFEKGELRIICHSKYSADSGFERKFDDVAAEIDTAVVIASIIELCRFA
jgi:hypothetical protein